MVKIAIKIDKQITGKLLISKEIAFDRCFIRVKYLGQ